MINPCGFTDKGVTSLKRLLGESQDIDLATNHIIKHFNCLFNMEPEIIDKEVFLRKIEGLYDGK